jgi:hypothetical protein
MLKEIKKGSRFQETYDPQWQGEFLTRWSESDPSKLSSGGELHPGVPKCSWLDG